MQNYRVSLVTLLLLFPVSLLADAGSTLREYRDTTVIEPGKKPAEPIQYSDGSVQTPAGELSEKHNIRTQIETIRVVGNTVLSPEELKVVLAPYTGHALSTSEIHAAAKSLMKAIRAKGLFIAKVYILPQDIINKTVVFNVIEGHLAKDGVVLGRSSERVKDEVVVRQLEHTLQPGTVITSEKYERAIYLTNDLPGIKESENLIFPAEAVGEAGFESIPQDNNPVTGNVYYDNYGSRSTGRNRWGTILELNSPTHHAEKITIGGNYSDLDTAFGYVDADMLLYPNGLRGGLMVNYLDYATDEPYDLRGTGMDSSVYLKYPVIRSRSTNLYSELHYTHTTLEDENDLGTLTDRILDFASLQLRGDKSDNLFGGGVNTARVEGIAGNVDLDNYKPFSSFDALHADTQGSFSLITASATRLQQVVGRMQAYLALSGQLSSKHMDPSQAFSFGGPYAFPGYHSGEIFGDKGWMLHSDLRYTFTDLPWQGNLQISAFFDCGSLTTHTVAIVNGFYVPGAIDTSYSMQSVGFGLKQSWDHFLVRGVIGWQVNNDIPDTLLDDGGEKNFQGWIYLAYIF